MQQLLLLSLIPTDTGGWLSGVLVFVLVWWFSGFGGFVLDCWVLVFVFPGFWFPGLVAVLVLVPRIFVGFRFGFLANCECLGNRSGSRFKRLVVSFSADHAELAHVSSTAPLKSRSSKHKHHVQLRILEFLPVERARPMSVGELQMAMGQNSYPQ